MSWSRRKVLPALAALVLLTLTGCGFSPLYGTASGDSHSSRELASIHVNPIADRSGQLLHNALIARLSPKGEPSRPVYTLTVRLTVSEYQVALQKDNSATRSLVTYTATYYLAQGNQTVADGTVTRTLGYDFLLEHYADISAAQDVRERAALIVAEEIRDELTAYFIRRTRALKSAGGTTP